MEREVIEKRTTVHDASVPAGQTTNVNVRPDGGADVQVDDPGADRVVEETTTTTRRVP